MIINPYRTPGESRFSLPRLAAGSVVASVGTFILPLLLIRLTSCGLGCIPVFLLLKYGLAFSGVGLGVYVRSKAEKDAHKTRDTALVGTVLGLIALVG